MKMTLSHQYLDTTLNLLDELGFPKNRALEILNLQSIDLAVSHDRIAIDEVLKCLTAAAEFTSDAYIGLRLGHKFRVGTYRSTGNLYGYCKTIEEVIRMNNLYQKVAIDVGGVKYLQDNEGCHQMCFIPYYSDLRKYRQITDMIMASYITAYRWLSWGSGADLICARLPYVQPEDIQTYSSILGTQIRRDGNHLSLELSDIAMSQVITTHNPERLAMARVTLDRLIDKQDACSSFEMAIEAAVRGAIEAGQVSAQIVADRMGLSGAAFRTRLANTGEGIRPRLDRIRKSLFIEKYDAGCSFSQIAMDLAYNDQAAMNRAFRRWYGMTPSQWRATESNRVNSV